VARIRLDEATGLRRIRRHTKKDLPPRRKLESRDVEAAHEDHGSALALKKEPAEKNGTSVIALRASTDRPFDLGSEYDIAGTWLTGRQIDAIRTDWRDGVMTRKLKVSELLEKHDITVEILKALRRRLPEELSWSRRRNPQRIFAPRVIAKAARIIRNYRDEKLSYEALKAALKEIGINPSQYRSLERQLPDGLQISRRASPEHQARRREYFNAFADDIEELLERHAWVVRKQTDLIELMNADAVFKEARGTFTYGRLNKLRTQDEKEADGRIAAIMERVKPEGKQGRRQPNGLGDDDPAPKPTASADGEPRASRREQLLRLAEVLEGRTPSEKNLKAGIAKVSKETGAKRSYHLWRMAMEQHKGVIPELARWRVGSKNRYELRWYAAWVNACHQAGPGASHEAVVEVFKRSREYRDDGRVPDAKQVHKLKEGTALGWRISADSRAKFQLARNMLEAIRTAPVDVDLKHILGSTPIQPQYDYEMGTYFLKTILSDGQYGKGLPAKDLDQEVIGALKHRPGRMYFGLGQSRDPTFDPNLEPPWSPLAICQKILQLPRLEDAPLLQYALSRMNGRLPFENSNVMIINHRYSDIVPFAEAMIGAGMSPSNSLFVSTPYAFDEAVDLGLNDLGVPQLAYPAYDEAKFYEAVEEGVRRMIAKFDEQERRYGQGKPILILDDGGAAARALQKPEFRAHAHKVKIVEITAAGYRVAEKLEREHLRLPFVFYSVANSMTKRKVASKFYARRVVARVEHLVADSKIPRINDRVVVLGGGPMGLFAAERYRQLGRDTAIVDPDPEVRAELIAKGFDPMNVFDTKDLAKALKGRGTILGMSGYFGALGPEHLDAIEDGAIVVQGSSKRNEFAMAAFEKRAKKKTEIPRFDGLPQRSYTYDFGRKGVHFLADGWTINHDGSLHGSPIEDVQLELAIIIESAAAAASDHSSKTGDVRQLGADIQEEYVARWRALKRERKQPRNN
jgi:S-adenosylhomocysteine hydrolase